MVQSDSKHQIFIPSSQVLGYFFKTVRLCFLLCSCQFIITLSFIFCC